MSAIEKMDEIAPEYDVVVLGTGKYPAIAPDLKPDAL